jgi:pimeloyl-ACP methyl ester carboxylesterase
MHSGISGSAPIVALHSSGSSGKQWAALHAAFAAEREVATLDFHGHGAGPAWHDDGASIVRADVRLVTERLDALPRGAHLVGHSYGGAIALQAALARPARVRSLTLYEPVAFNLLLDFNRRHAPAVEILEVGTAIVRNVRIGELAGAAERFVSYWSGSAAWAALNEAQQGAVAARMPAIAAQFRSIFTDRMRLADLRTLHLPVLVVGGGRSKRPTRRIVELLQWALPQAEATSMPAAGHMGPVTDAATFVGLARAFIDRHEPALRAAA